MDVVAQIKTGEEEQAIMRIHRIGQTKDVSTTEPSSKAMAVAELSCDGVLITLIMLCYSAGKGLPTGLSFELVNPKHVDEAEKQLL